MRHLLPMLVLLSACATITKDNQQMVSVATDPAGAHCTLTNQVDSWDIPETPGEVAVTRSFSPLTVRCTAPDGRTGSAVIEPKTRGRAYGNILLGGVPAIVDANTGAGYEYAPRRATIPLK